MLLIDNMIILSNKNDSILKIMNNVFMTSDDTAISENYGTILLHDLVGLKVNQNTFDNNMNTI